MKTMGSIPRQSGVEDHRLNVGVHRHHSILLESERAYSSNWSSNSTPPFHPGVGADCTDGGFQHLIQEEMRSALFPCINSTWPSEFHFSVFSSYSSAGNAG